MNKQTPEDKENKNNEKEKTNLLSLQLNEPPTLFKEPHFEPTRINIDLE